MKILYAKKLSNVYYASIFGCFPFFNFFKMYLLFMLFNCTDLD